MSFEHSTPDDAEYAIEVDGLGKCYQIYEKPSDRLMQMLVRGRKQYYKEFWALKDVNFKIKKGETYGIIGRNGAGKSTLLQLISGTLNPTDGVTTINGRVAALLELGAGFNPEFTGRENVEMTASIYGLSKDQIVKRFDSIQEFADIGLFIDHPVKTYSSGMYVRLAFSVIAHVDADILVVDEALSVGDVRFQQKCIRFLQDFKAKNGTLLFVSHDISMVMAICEKVLYLNRQRDEHMSFSGNADAMCKAYLKDIYSDQQAIDYTHSYLDSNNQELSMSRLLTTSSDDKKIISTRVPASESTVSIGNYNLFAESFGDGSGSIIDVLFIDSSNKRLPSIKTADRVCLAVEFRANNYIVKPVVTIILKDKAGQFIFVDGSVDSHNKNNISLLQNQHGIIQFEFIFPSLTEGVYSMDVSLANGNHIDHTTVHWVYDALELRVSQGRNVVGICGFSNLHVNWLRHEL